MKRHAVTLSVVLLSFFAPVGVAAGQDMGIKDFFLSRPENADDAGVEAGQWGVNEDDDCPAVGVGCVPGEEAMIIEQQDRTVPTLILPALLVVPLAGTALYLFSKALWDKFKS